MNETGKSLVLYLRYFHEMHHAFEEGRRFPGVDPAKVKVVGNAAGAEAENLLTACTAEWFDRLERSKVANFKRSRRETVRRNWAIEIDIRPRGQKASVPLKHQIGVLLDRDHGLIPWVWSRGGVVIEDKIRDLLPRGTKSLGSKEYGWTGGSLALNPTAIPWNTATEFSLNADSIIKQTKDTLELVDSKFVGRLLKL